MPRDRRAPPGLKTLLPMKQSPKLADGRCAHEVDNRCSEPWLCSCECQVCKRAWWQDGRPVATREFGIIRRHVPEDSVLWPYDYRTGRPKKLS